MEIENHLLKGCDLQDSPNHGGKLARGRAGQHHSSLYGGKLRGIVDTDTMQSRYPGLRASCSWPRWHGNAIDPLRHRRLACGEEFLPGACRL